MTHFSWRTSATLLLAAVAFALIAAGCGSSSSSSGTTSSSTTTAPSNGPYDLTFTGTGYTPHIGEYVYVALMDDATNTRIDLFSTIITSTASFSHTFAGAMPKGGLYRVDWYVDYNGGTPNGVCDAPATDHQWRIPITDTNGDGTNNGLDNGTTSATAVSNNVTVTHAHDTTFTSVCASFL